MPSVSLEMYENLGGLRETEDVNTHHLLQQHLYKSRKQVSNLIHWADMNMVIIISRPFLTVTHFPAYL